MPLNFVTTKPTNVISIWSWQHPELANYDANVEEELEWIARQLYKKLYPDEAKGMEDDEKRKAEELEAKRPKGPFLPRIVKPST